MRVRLARDRFGAALPPGQVVGSHGPEAGRRLGVDREGIISIDNGAVRIAPPIVAGWGRHALAWGPFTLDGGLWATFSLMDGHNTSQAEPLSERFGKRMATWLRGPRRTLDGAHAVRRLAALARSGRADRVARAVAAWFTSDERTRRVPPLDDNLAVGFFADPAASDGAAFGPGFIMRALGPRNGALRVGAGATRFTVLEEVQNLPLALAVHLQPGRATFYAGTVPGARGLPAWPSLRPLGVVDVAPHVGPWFAGLQQSVLGQIGFRADTRVHGVDVWRDEETPVSLPLEQARDGVQLDEPAGLITARLAGAGPAGLIFRRKGDSYWSLRLLPGHCELVLTMAGDEAVVASGPAPGLIAEVRLQILDDGETLRVHVAGEDVFTGPIADGRLGDGRGVGVWRPDGAPANLRDLQAHGRVVRAPAWQELPFPTPLPAGTRAVLVDDLGAPDGAPRELSEHVSHPGGRWRRQAGQGRIALEPGGARVKADAAHPSPERTIYTVPWSDPQLADLSVDIVPPGSGRNQQEKCRAGVVFFQDDDNHVIVSIYLDDHYGGASVSSFFHLRGYEDLYDAVWTNVGARIRWGHRFNLRVVFDGAVYQAFVNGEAVLYRALTDVYPDQPRLAIKRVGLVSNWEWGEDTGSQLSTLRGRARNDVKGV